MRSITYDKSSPYADTTVYGHYLEVMTNRSIPKRADDVLYTLNEIYMHRPDLLAYDLYDDVNLWWVFAARNPNTIQDPIFDFLPGAVIYVPKHNVIKQALGI